MIASLSQFRHAAAALAAALAAAGCGGVPEHLADCAPDDDACQRTWVTETWETDQQRVVAELGALSDPIAQLALVQELVEAHPGQTRDLCPVLPAGPGRDRCRSLNSRPHLWQVDVEAATAAAAQADADADAVQPEDDTGGEDTIAETPTPPWAGLAPVTEPCASTPELCQSTAAIRLADAGDRDGAVARCLAIDEDKWRYECLFQAAEHLLGDGGGDRVREAVEVCAAAGPYASRCLTHTTWAQAHLAPAASEGDAAAWEAVVARAAASDATLRATDPAVADTYSGRLWAEVLRFSYDGEAEVTGRPLDYVPAETTPLVKAAAAWQLWNNERHQRRSLEAWAARLEEALALRAPTSTRRRATRQRKFYAFADLWKQHLPGEEAFSAVAYLGGSQRIALEDPTLDAMVCILEIAGRSRGAGDALLAEALQHERSEIRWTAARLLQESRPSSPLLAQARKDPDPLVRVRTRVDTDLLRAAHERPTRQ